MSSTPGAALRNGQTARPEAVQNEGCAPRKVSECKRVPVLSFRRRRPRCWGRRKKLREKLRIGRNRALFTHNRRTAPFFLFFSLIRWRVNTKRNWEKKTILPTLSLSLRRNDLLNEQLAPGARINVSIVAFTTCLFFPPLLAQRHLYNDDNRD